LIYLVSSIEFSVPLYTPFCMNYELQKNSVVHGPYIVRDDGDWFRLTVTVLASDAEELYKKEGNQGILTFTAHEGRHAICFQGLPVGQARARSARVALNITESDFETKADDLKIHTVENTLKQIEQKVAYLAINFKVSKTRMQLIGEVVDVTASRIPFFSACFVGTVIIFGFAQIFYLRGFFAKRKLI